MIINILKIAVGLFSTVLLIRIVRSFLKRENQNLLLFPVAFYYIFFVLPILLDVFIGRYNPPSSYYGFYVSYDNLLVEIMYLIGVVISMTVFYRSFKKNVYHWELDYLFKHKDLLFFVVLAIGILSMIFILVRLDNESIEKIFAYDTRYYMSDSIVNFIRNYSLILSIVLLVPLFFEKKPTRFWLKLLTLSPLLLFLVLCNGKKSIVFLLLVIILFILYSNKIVKSSVKFLLLSLASLCFLLVFYNFYLGNVVTSNNSSFSEKYNTYRVEFGRDDTQKMVIYDEIFNGDKKILSYRGESLLFYPTFFIRREEWPQKPYPFATYLTAKLFNLSEVKELGWNMTTSIYDELICNTGLIAIIYTPFLICFLANLLMKKLKWDSLLDVSIKFLGILLISLSLTVQLNARLMLNLIFVLLLIIRFIFALLSKKKKVTA